MATKFYLRSTTSSESGLPSAEQHTSFTSDYNMDAQSTNRTLSTTKGTSQTYFSGSPNGNVEVYFSKFVSDSLASQTITAQTWTINLAAYSQHHYNNFPNSGSGPLQVNLYAWRPSSSTKVGTIYQGGTSNVNEATTTERVKHATFSGSSVSIAGGDVIILELWADYNSLAGLTVAFYYNGTTENSTPEAAVSNHASYLNTPQTLTFGGAETSLVSQETKHKYHILSNAAMYVSQSTTHRYHVNPAEGFTVFTRLYIPYAINESLYGRRQVIFSKIDDEQVEFAYVAQMDDAGNMYWFVRCMGKSNWIKASNVFDPQNFKTPDYTSFDFESTDYFTETSLGYLPEPIPYTDVAFTYFFKDRRMQIISDAQTVMDTDLAPVTDGLVGRWLLKEGSGLKCYNSVPNAPNGDIYQGNATWQTYDGRTYLDFNDTVSNSGVQISTYDEIRWISEFTVSLWYYPTATPTTGENDFLVYKSWNETTNTFILYYRNSGGSVQIRGIVKDSTTTSASVRTETLTLNTWNHLVIRWRGTGTPTEIFVNNSKYASGTNLNDSQIDLWDDNDLTIGDVGLSSTPGGAIRDVQFFNRGLTDTEVASIYNAGETYPLTYGLVGHWMCDEGGDIGNTPTLPTEYYSIVRNSVKFLGAQDGTITDAGWAQLAGKPHESYLRFANDGDKVIVPSYTEIQNLAEITVSLWYYHEADAAFWRGLIWKGPSDGPNTWLIYIEANGTIRFVTWNQADTRKDAIGPVPVVGTWYHIIGRYRLSTGEQSVTVNEAKFTNNTISGTIDTGSGNDVNIGRGFTDANHITGLLYDIRIWNRQLTDAEVTALYNMGQASAGFPPWMKEADPPPDVPVPITNPYVEVYNVSVPTQSNQELVRMHAVVATGFEEKYQVDEGSFIAENSPPFSTLIDQPPTGGGGGGGSPETNYDVSHSSDSHLEFEDGRSRWAAYVGSGASVINKVVTKVTFRGRKYGNPSGTVYCYIWKAGGGTVLIDSTSVAGWSDSDADQYTFESTGNSYQCVQGDRIGFQISWSPSSNDSIECGQIDSGYDSYTTQYYDGGWDDEPSGDTMAMKIESGSPTGGTDVEMVWPAFNETCFGCHAGANGLDGFGLRVPSGSALIGKKPTRVTFWMKIGQGSPSGTIYCYLQKNGGTSSSQFGSSISAGTITGTLTPYLFTDTNNGGDNGYALQANDRIYLYYRSQNASNSIITQRLLGTTVGDAIETWHGDSNPATTSTTITWVNTSNNDACIKVEEGGYTEPAKNPWIELDNVTTRIGERVKTTGSALYLKQITKVKALIQAVGNPSGTIYCKVRDASNTERGQIGQYDASTISTTEFQEIEFLNIYQSWALQDEHAIWIEWTGGTSTNKLRVNIKHEETDVDPEPNTTVVQYDGAYTEIAADLAGSMYTGGSATDPDARIRVGEKVALETSTLNFEKISRATLRMKRTGSTTPGKVYLRIRDPEDDSITGVVSEIDATAIPTGESEVTLTKVPVNTVSLLAGGVLTVEYDDGDDNNYVEVMVSKVNAFDDTAKTYLVKYDALLGQYEQKTTYELVGKLETGGDTYTPSADEIPPPDPPNYNHDLMVLAGGYDWTYGGSAANWLNAIPPDIRFYRKVLSLIELLNIFTNRLDRAKIGYGDVARIGYFIPPEFP